MAKIGKIQVVLAALALVSLSGCSSVSDAAAGGEFGGPEYDYGYAADDAAGAGVSGEGTDGDGNDGGSVLPGQLTAGAWDDNKHYDFFKNLFTVYMPSCVDGTETAENGAFSVFLGENAWGMSVLDRVEVTVTDGEGKPAAGARVALTSEDGEKVLAQTFSGADGKAYLFPDGETAAGTFSVVGGYDGELVEATEIGDGYALELEESRVYGELDLCFMIDTTGSMGDELSYLQAELGDVISEVRTECPTADIRLGLVFYRDEGDEYVTKKFDFTDDIAAAQRALAAESATGGGDYPEAVHEALRAALGLSWREGSKKILVPVLDAPPHTTKTEQDTARDIRSEYGGYVYAAAEKGVSVLPVAASGADLTTQYLTRSAALMTGGAYVFITDDSGIGNEHETPAIGEFTVEYLNDCLTRLIAGLYDGKERPAVDYRQAK